MKFEFTQPGFDPIVLSWKTGTDAHEVRLELLHLLEKLKLLIDEEFDHDEDFSEVGWTNDRILKLKEFDAVNPMTSDGRGLAYEFYLIAHIEEELDRVTDKDAGVLIRELRGTAANALVRET